MTLSAGRLRSSGVTTNVRLRTSKAGRLRNSGVITNVRLRTSNAGRLRSNGVIVSDKPRISNVDKARNNNARPIAKDSGSSARNKSDGPRISSVKLRIRSAATGNKHALTRKDGNKTTAAATIRNDRPKSNGGMLTSHASVIGNDAAMMISAGLRTSNGFSINNAGRPKIKGG